MFFFFFNILFVYLAVSFSTSGLTYAFVNIMLCASTRR